MPPDTILVSGPAAGSSTTSKYAMFQVWTVNANGLQCSLDGRPFAPVASPRVAPRCRPTYSGLAPGPPTFRAQAWDWAGNVDPTLVTRTWTVLP